MAMARSNQPDTREGWLRAATSELRSYFNECGYTIPDNLRFAIAFTSTGRKGKRVGECWHSSTSDDAHYEIFLRADLAEPVEVLAVLVKELVHTLLPPNAGHGKLFKAAAIKIGLQGPMRQARPGPLLHDRLKALADTLGPLPHARLDISQQSMVARVVPVGQPKKQRARMLKAECEVEGCGYVVRVAATHARTKGPPGCPVHGAMRVDLPAVDEELPETKGGEGEEVREAV
jgi:hypothetical protein